MTENGRFSLIASENNTARPRTSIYGMCKSRAWAIPTIFIVACIVALGVGLGFGLGRTNPDTNNPDSGRTCPSPESSSRLTPDLPLYTTPTSSIEGRYKFGAVATDSPICSTIGTEMLIRHGGSAVDAAIATILCVGVYHPQSCGIGGGFFMTYYKRAERTNHVIMAREMAPGASTQNMFTENGWDSIEGAKAVAVPGEVKGMYEAWILGGKLPWKTLFQPAIQMCIEGFKVGRKLATDIEGQKLYFENHQELKQMLTNPITNTSYKEGDLIKLPKLGATLQKIADDPFTFYNGTLAEDIIKDLEETGGIITADDLKNFKAAVKDALSMNLTSGYTVISPPPPSSGGIVLFILNILEGFNFKEDSIATVSKAVETYHRIIEAFKHGYSARTKFGDADVESQQFKDNLQELLLNITSSAYGAEKRRLITDRTHTTSYYQPLNSGEASDAGTSHISLLAPNGDAVSVTSTINLWFGSKVVGRRTGIIFNDEMDDFSTPNTTNFFGIPASEANFIKPGKRPLSSMSPTIVINSTSGDVILVVGSSGGSRIITSTAFITLETILFKLGIKESIDVPRIHHQLLPDEIRITDRFQQVLRNGLEERGHKFNVDVPGSVVQAVLQRKQDEIFANSDHSKYGLPDGV